LIPGGNSSAVSVFEILFNLLLHIIIFGIVQVKLHNGGTGGIDIGFLEGIVHFGKFTSKFDVVNGLENIVDPASDFVALQCIKGGLEEEQV
jgi:hypothetical protein